MSQVASANSDEPRTNASRPIDAMAHADSPATTAASLSPLTMMATQPSRPTTAPPHGMANAAHVSSGWRRDWNALSPIRAIRVANGRDNHADADGEGGVFTPIVDGASGQHEQPDQTGDDGGEAADAKRHGKPLPVFGRGADAAQVQVRVERAQEEIRRIERPDGSIVEDRGELVAVALAPTRGIEADEQVRHDRDPSAGRPAEPLETELCERGELVELRL